MVEKIKNLDFNNMNQDESSEILSEILSLNEDEMKESLYFIIDSINYEDTDLQNSDDLSVFYKTIFGDEKVKDIMQKFLEDYENNI